MKKFGMLILFLAFITGLLPPGVFRIISFSVLFVVIAYFVIRPTKRQADSLPEPPITDEMLDDAREAAEFPYRNESR